MIRTGVALSLLLAVGCANAAIGDRDAGDAARDDSSAAADACIPDCAGRECGDDGCGDTCAPGCASTSSCIAGTCEPICAEAWTTTLPGVSSGRMLWVDGRLYVAGSTAASGWVGELDACDGSVDDQVGGVAPAAATSAKLFSLALIGAELYAFGDLVTATDPGNGLYARVARDGLEVDWSAPLYGSADVDEGWDIVATLSGNLWMVGTAGTAASASPWAIKGNDAGQACGFAPMAGNGGARALAVAGDNVYIGLTVDGSAHIVRFLDGDCATSSPCPCTPSWTSPAITVGSIYTEPLHMILADGSAYLGGYAADSATPDDAYAFVVRVDLGTGAVTGSYTWNPTAAIDAFGAMARDGANVYVVGVHGWDGSASFASGTATLHAIPHPLAGSSSPAAWIHNLASVDVFLGVAVDGAGWVYAAGPAGADSVVLRCTTAGTCP